MKHIILCLLFSPLMLSFAGAQNPILGHWKTVDDNSGRQKSIIEITERNGKIYGKIMRIYPDPGVGLHRAFLPYSNMAKTYPVKQTNYPISR